MICQYIWFNFKLNEGSKINLLIGVLHGGTFSPVGQNKVTALCYQKGALKSLGHRQNFWSGTDHYCCCHNQTTSHFKHLSDISLYILAFVTLLSHFVWSTCRANIIFPTAELYGRKKKASKTEHLMFVAILTALFTAVDVACSKGAGFAQEINVRWC